jgi:hypothetical protein
MKSVMLTVDVEEVEDVAGAGVVPWVDWEVAAFAARAI